MRRNCSLSRATIVFTLLAAIFSAFSAAPAPSFATCEKLIFGGPWVFTRQAGPPQTKEVSFSLKFPNTNYILRVINGNEDGSNQVHSGWIWFNDTQIVKPSDFNPHVGLIERTVSANTNNTLKVKLASTPGSFITIYLYGDDSIAPLVKVTEPLEGSLFETNAIEAKGTVDDPLAQVTVNGVSATLTGNNFTVASLPLAAGSNTMTATAIDPCGNSSSDTVAVTLVPLSIEITSPQNGASFLERQIIVSGAVSRLGVSVTVNGIPATVIDHTFIVSAVPLFPGSNTITAQANHLTETKTDTIIVTGIPLDVTITSPIEGQPMNNQSITVIGTVSHPAATVTVNGVSATVNGTNFTAKNVHLVNGSNTIIAIAAYEGSNNAQDAVSVTLLVPQKSPVQYFYDDLGRLIKAQDDAGNAIEYTYDSVGNRQTKTITIP